MIAGGMGSGLTDSRWTPLHLAEGTFPLSFARHCDGFDLPSLFEGVALSCGIRLSVEPENTDIAAVPTL
jgi:hypothetical protein